MSVSDYLIFPELPASVKTEHVWLTDVSDAQSGFQQVLAQWTRPLFKFNLDLGPMDQTDHAALVSFMMAVRMKQNPFLFKHPLSYSLVKAPFGTSTGAQAVWLLKRYYVSSGVTFSFNASMIIASTLTVYADNAAVSASDWTLNDETGVLTFQAGHIPTVGKALTASFEYYHKARMLEWTPYEQNNPAAVAHSMVLQEIM